jgi:hypothetical protein
MKKSNYFIIITILIFIIFTSCKYQEHKHYGTVPSIILISKKDSLVNIKNYTIIRGFIKDSSINKPAEFATIYSDDRSVIIKIDSTGEYFQKIPIGTYYLNFAYVASNLKKTEPIVFKENEVVILNVTLGYDYVE